MVGVVAENSGPEQHTEYLVVWLSVISDIHKNEFFYWLFRRWDYDFGCLLREWWGTLLL